MCDQHQRSEDTGMGLAQQRTSGLHPHDPLPVVIIGNGPSGICLSYLLSGHRPYVKTGASHPNPILHGKLQAVAGKCLLEQDLEYLSEGLEGRSHSPLGLLLDALLRPDGDLGGPAETLLAWRREPEHCVTHLVLGKGPVGGAWQLSDQYGHHRFKPFNLARERESYALLRKVMEPSMVTLSLGEWMELPDLPFRDWMKKRGRQLRNNRATTRDISQYYQHYVQAKSLQEHFCSGRLVTSVRRVPLDARKDESSGLPSTLFEVQGVWETANGERSPFCLYAQNVVLATGAYDSPGRLGVEGEEPPMVFHTIGDLERALRECHLGPSSDPLLVVGAGLTAADGVLLAHRSSVPILHTFRRAVRDSALVFKQLPPLMFPEYHKVYDMMSQQALAGGGSYRGYTSLPGHRVLRFHPGGTATLEEGATGKKRVISISMALVLIGSNPNLSFLPDGGRGLALDPGQPVDAKRNPIDTDSFSYECVQEQGLYALGPLAGDSFVRFLQGGALGVATSLMKKQGLV